MEMRVTMTSRMTSQMLNIFKIFDKDDTIKDWLKSVDFQKIWQKEKEDMKIRWMIQTETKNQNVIKIISCGALSFLCL